MMRALTRLLLTAALLVALPAVAPAGETIDLSGQWEITAEVFPVQQQPQEGGQTPCSFAGTADITQDGSEFGGTAELELLDGPAECPLEMDADVSGAIDEGGNVEAAMLDGQLGTAFFSGTFGIVDEIEGGGTVDTETGPFGGSSGTWSAALGAPPVQAIPTLTGLGLIGLVVLLAVSALLVVRRRPAV